MRKLLSKLIKFCAYPFLLVGFCLAVLSGVVRNGWKKTEKKIDDFCDAMDDLKK